MSLLKESRFNFLTPFFAGIHVMEAFIKKRGQLPDELARWLGKLKLLNGVPINYIVPDERMLPPESIRFFYVDDNWINALIDGAFSIGRNLTKSEHQSKDLKQDKASNSLITEGAQAQAGASRAKALGRDITVAFHTISGFILRSAVVKDYPGLGVDAYPNDKTPDDPNPSALNILRLERLGPDTLICLVDGDIHQIDIHEAPEALHYGLDSFAAKPNKIEAKKNIYTFSKTSDKNDEVTMASTPTELDLSKKDWYRAADNRTINMSQISQLIGQAQTPIMKRIDAAEMGFEMIVGVGKVSFKRT